MEKYRKKLKAYLHYLYQLSKNRKELKKYIRRVIYLLYQKAEWQTKVSVVIPIYDRTTELKESIQSILNQSHRNIELILVTDGSPKETMKIVNSYDDNPRVKIFHYYDNSGNAVRGRNKAIREATGKYFAFQDSDDIADKHRIRNSLKYIKRYKVDGVYGGWRAKLDGTRRNTGLENNQEVFSPDSDFEMMKKLCVPCQSTVMIKTDVLKSLGGLKTSMGYREDHELWLRFLKKGYTFKSIPKILTNLRLHKGNAELLFKDNDDKWLKILEKEYKKENSLKEKIAYIIPSTGVGGGLAVIIQHANRLIKRGYDVLLISVDGKDKIDWIKCSAQVVPLGTQDQYYFKNIDILIATYYDTVQFLEKLDSKRKLYFVQSDERRFFEMDQTKEIKRVENTYKSNYEFFTEAIWIQKWLKDEFNKDAYYVPNGLDTNLFKKTKPLKEKGKRKRVLIEGPIDIWFKGMYDAYYAVKDLDVELWIVSTAGKPPTYWRYDKFFSCVPISKMAEVYSSCDFLLKMSRVEGFFGPPLEAMSCGCIPIVTNVTGYDEYIKDGENALVINIGDTDSAKKAIIRLMKDSSLREKLKKNGYKTAQEWNWERSIDLLEKAIKRAPIEKYYSNEEKGYSYKEELKRVYSLS